MPARRTSDDASTRWATRVSETVADFEGINCEDARAREGKGERERKRESDRFLIDGRRAAEGGARRDGDVAFRAPLLSRLCPPRAVSRP